MNISFEQAGQHKRVASLSVDAGESVYVLHPNQIVAFRGAPSLREDSFFSLSGMYRKRRLIRSRIHGPARFLLGLPEGYSLGTFTLTEADDWLFEFKHVLYYQEGLQMRTEVQKMRNALMTRDFVKMRVHGPGTVGLLTAGPLYAMELHPTEPLYVDMRCLVAYPPDVGMRPCVYGNTLASQHMNYHWELTGRGSVLLQPSMPDKTLDEQMQSDSLVRRVLREVIPFGGIFIK